MCLHPNPFSIPLTDVSVGLLCAGCVLGAVPEGPGVSNIGGRRALQSHPHQFSFGRSRIRIYLMNFLSFLLISACLLKNKEFLWPARERPFRS